MFAPNPARGLCFRFPLLVAVVLVIISTHSTLAQQQELPENSSESPPPAPTLRSHPALTTELTATLHGETIDGVSIEVVGPTGTTNANLYALASKDNPRGEGVAAFRTQLDLRPNSINDVLFTAITSTGIRSAPTTTTIIHDTEAPELFIDFPRPGDVIATDHVDVFGRVSDRLSGFMGLRVAIQGAGAQFIEAEVDIGIGSNGTFLAEQVPIAVDGTTRLRAFAIDHLQNQTLASVEVIQETPLGAQMVEISGSRQQGPIGTELLQPLRVQVLNTDGSVFENKIVTFEVTRSNGLLRSIDDPNTLNRSLQIRTDPNGMADALWTLGSDSGCGNNRVVATSTSIAAPVTFCASATPGPGTQINIATGNDQQVEVGTIAPEALRVWVSDSCNPIAEIPVTFIVVRGSGFVNGESFATVSTSATGHAEVEFMLGPDPGNNIVEATYSGNLGPSSTFFIYGHARQPGSPTSFTGVVLDNSRTPIVNAECVLEQGDTSLTKLTNAAGRFQFENIPFAGPAHLLVDGSPGGRIHSTRGTPSFPSLEYSIVLIPNTENSLPRPVLLPPLTSPAVEYQGQGTVELTVNGIDGLKMILRDGTEVEKADGSLVSPSNPIFLSLNQVHHDDMPMPMPDGASPPFAWTLQPAGTHFEPPLEIEYPNMNGLPPGSISYFLSFDHDTNRFEIVGSGQVSANGSLIRSDPGTGIAKAGWGGSCPPYSVSGDVEGDDEEDDDPPCPEAEGVRLAVLPDNGFEVSSDLSSTYIVALVTRPDPNTPDEEIPIEGATIEWEFAIGNGTLSSPTSDTDEFGAAVVEVFLPQHAGRPFSIRAGLTQAPIYGMDVEFSLTQRSGTFFVVPGNPATITMERSKDFYSADATDSVEINALVVDSAGNTVADGTFLDWSLDDSTTDFVERDEETRDGMISATLRAPEMAYSQIIHLDGGTATASDVMFVTRSDATLIASRNTLDLALSESATLSATVEAADGTPVFWTVSNGNLSTDSEVSGGRIQATLSSTGAQLGLVAVTATVAGDLLLVWQGTFISSQGLAAGPQHQVLVGDETTDGIETIIWENGVTRRIPYKASTPFFISGPPDSTIQVTLPDSPILEGYTFESQSGGTVPAAVGTTSMILGGAELVTTKPHLGSSSLHLDGSDAPQIAHSNTINFLSSFDISLWVCPEIGDANILRKGNAWQLELLSDLTVQATIMTSDGVFTATTSRPVSLQSWSAIGLQLQDDVLRVFAGSDHAETPVTGSLTQNGAPLLIGEAYSGQIDDLSFRSQPGSHSLVRFEDLDGAGQVRTDSTGATTIRILSRGTLDGTDLTAFAEISLFLEIPGSLRGGFFSRLALRTKQAAVAVADRVAVFLGVQDPENAKETAVAMYGGVLAIGDYGALVKNAWRFGTRLAGGSGEPVNTPEVIFSGIGLLTTFFPVADAVVASLRSIASLLGDTPLLRLLGRRITKHFTRGELPPASEVALIHAMADSPDLAIRLDSILTDEALLETTIRVFERLDSEFLLNLLVRLENTPVSVRENVVRFISTIDEEVIAAIRLDPAYGNRVLDGLAATFSRDVSFPLLNLAVKNPDGYIRSTYSPIALLDDLPLIADAERFQDLLAKMPKHNNPGYMTEARHAATLRRNGAKRISLTTIFNSQAGKTDFDIIARFPNGAVEYAETKFGRFTLTELETWVNKVRKATISKPNVQIRYYYNSNSNFRPSQEILDKFLEYTRDPAINFAAIPTPF